VDLDFHSDVPRMRVGEYGGYKVLPTVPAPLEAMTTKVNAFLDKVQGLPLDEIGNDLRDAVRGIKGIVSSKQVTGALAELEPTLKQVHDTALALEENALPELEAALRQARTVLKSADGVVSPDSALQTELKRMLRELSAAARSIRLMADYLERHPEALIQGKGGLR
jgi:paraquat-inducible protein B